MSMRGRLHRRLAFAGYFGARHRLQRRCVAVVGAGRPRWEAECLTAAAPRRVPLATAAVGTPEASWRSRPSGRLGVFAGRPYAAGQVVERCYCLPLAPSAVPNRKLQLWLYQLCYGQPLLLPLGWGLLYNETSSLGGPPNLTCEFEQCRGADDSPQWYINLRANIDVAAGEELCVLRQPSAARAAPLQDMTSAALAEVIAQLEAEAAASFVRDGDWLEGAGSGADDLYRSSGGLVMEASRSPRSSLENGLEQLAAIFEADSTSVCISGQPVREDQHADIVRGMIHPPRGVEVRPSPVHGNGVFACRPLPKDTVVEIAPNLLVMRDWLGQSVADYCYQAFEPDCGARKLALGLGSIYNHSEEPNLRYCIATSAGGGCAPAQLLSTRYYTSRDVDVGEELFIHYGSTWWTSRGH